jgi:ribonuclease R
VKQVLEPTMHLGEIVVGQKNTLCIKDLLTDLSYPLPVNSGAIPYEQGQIVSFSIANKSPEMDTIVAQSGSASAQLYKLASSKNLSPFFPEQVEIEVQQILNKPDINDPAIANLEHLAFCTIDGKDTLDLDQALHVQQTTDGYVIRYAIADAAYYIKPGSALFSEALQRGTSYYLPGLMIPMLPRELCLGVISLNEAVNRRAVIFEMHLDQRGCLQHSAIVRAKIKSRAKLSFEEVQHFLNNSSVMLRDDTQLSSSIKCFQQVGLLRMKLAEERNVVRYHRTDINLKLGHNGIVFKLLDSVRNEVELYNEQLSLLCNTVGAMILADDNGTDNELIQPIYKVHPAPTADKLKTFESAIERLIEIHHLDPVLWKWQHDGTKPLADYLKSLPRTGEHAGLTQAIHRQAIMTNARSSFSKHPEQHYGVGAEVYARFSSPMREIVGVFLHKELMEKISGHQTPEMEQEDQALRAQVIQIANRAKDIQNQLTNEANLLVLDQIFFEDLNLPETQRPVRTGTIIGLGRDKLYILLDEISIEIKLHIRPLETLWNKTLFIDQEQLCLFSKDTERPLLRLGEQVQVTVHDHDQDKQRWIFSLNKVPLQ